MFALPPAELFAYDAWPSREPMEWFPNASVRGDDPLDALDFHVDLGCGRVPKARIGVDRYAAVGVNVLMDLNGGEVFHVAREPGGQASASHSLLQGRKIGLPFATDSIESIITYHCFEHIGAGFVDLMDECYRVLVPGGLLRIIVPQFPSWAAVSDPDHKRYFMAHGDTSTFGTFCGTPDTEHWMESFSVPYTRARFVQVGLTYTPPVAPEVKWTPHDVPEIRIGLRAAK